jgi:hypothetical protein
MFHLVLVCAAILVADKSSAAAKEEPRPFHAIQAEISDLLKREAQAKTPANRSEIVQRMCALHREILRDERYTTSDTLADYRIRLWSRLRRVQAELKRQLARSGNKSDRAAAADEGTLAPPDELSLAAAESLATSLSMLDQSQGGPGFLMGSAGSAHGAFGGGAGSGDWGDELVDLIEQTINPAFWDVNGGPGTIVYYAPLRCIVVRATSEMHGSVGGILGGLRAAGK